MATDCGAVPVDITAIDTAAPCTTTLVGFSQAAPGVVAVSVGAVALGPVVELVPGRVIVVVAALPGPVVVVAPRAVVVVVPGTVVVAAVDVVVVVEVVVVLDVVVALEVGVPRDWRPARRARRWRGWRLPDNQGLPPSSTHQRRTPGTGQSWYR